MNNVHQSVIYLHSFGSVFVVKLHVIARLNPADGPALFTGHRRHHDPSRRAEMRRPVAQHHAGGLIDTGGVRVDGGVHLQNRDTVPKTLGFTPDTLDATHHQQHQRAAEHQPLKITHTHP